MARKPPGGEQGEMRDILRRITDKLSRVQKPDIDNTLKELRTGFHEFRAGAAKGSKAALSAGKTLEKVVKILRAGVPPEEIPPEVAARFDWSRVLDDVELYAEKMRVDPDDLMRALSRKTRRRATPPKRSGTYQREPAVEAVAKDLGVSPKRLTAALHKAAAGGKRR